MECVLLLFLDQIALFNNFLTKSEIFQSLLGHCAFWKDYWRKEEIVYSVSFYIHYTIIEVAVGHPESGLSVNVCSGLKKLCVQCLSRRPTAHISTCIQFNVMTSGSASKI